MKAEHFDLACRAFGLMTLAERRRVIAVMSALRYTDPEERFFDAVSQVVPENPAELLLGPRRPKAT